MKTIFSKTSFVLILISLLISFNGCKKIGLKKKQLIIDLFASFDSDRVEVKLDDKTVFFSNDVKTGHCIAESILLDYPTGKYKLTVIVNGLKATDTFSHKQDQIIMISYRRQEAKIDFTYFIETYKYLPC